MLIVQKARLSQLARDYAATEPRIAFEHDDFLAGGRQIGRSHQTVMTRTDGDDVCAAHDVSDPQICCGQHTAAV